MHAYTYIKLLLAGIRSLKHTWDICCCREVIFG